MNCQVAPIHRPCATDCGWKDRRRAHGWPHRASDEPRANIRAPQAIAARKEFQSKPIRHQSQYKFDPAKSNAPRPLRNARWKKLQSKATSATPRRARPTKWPRPQRHDPLDLHATRAHSEILARHHLVAIRNDQNSRERRRTHRMRLQEKDHPRQPAHWNLSQIEIAPLNCRVSWPTPHKCRACFAIVAPPWTREFESTE